MTAVAGTRHRAAFLAVTIRLDMSAARGLRLNVTVLVLMRGCKILDDTVSRFGLIADDTLVMSALTGGGKREPCAVQCTGRLKTIAVAEAN